MPRPDFRWIGNRKPETDGTTRRDTVGKVQRLRDVRAAPLGLEVQDLAYHAQDMAAAFFRRDVLLDLVGEQDQPDLVAVADGGEGKNAGQLRRQLALALDAPNRNCRRR